MKQTWVKKFDLLMITGLVLTLGCGDGASDLAPSSPSVAEDPASVVVYSGRNESLIGPLLENFESEKGIEVRVRYADTAELTAMLLEEGAEILTQVYFPAFFIVN